MFTRLVLSLLLGFVLSSEATAQKRKNDSATVGPAARVTLDETPRRRVSTGIVFSHQDSISILSGVQTSANPFAGNDIGIYLHHIDYTNQWLADRPSIWREDRFASFDPADLDGPASFIEVFIDDWKFASYRSFSFHVLADDVVGLEIKSNFSF